MNNRRSPADNHVAAASQKVTKSPIRDFLHTLVSSRRGQKEGRLQGSHDAGRLIVLGIMVIDLAAIAIANAVLGRLIVDYRPGMASLFAGLLFAIIVIRLGRPGFYLDWIANGILHCCFGLILTTDAYLVETWSSIGFYLILIGCAFATTWIGVTLQVDKGRPSVIAGGLASLAVALYAIVDRLAVHTIAPDVILATALLLLGLSTGSLGMSLRKQS